MNKRMVIYTLGRLLQIQALFLLAPAVVSVVYQEPLRYLFSFLAAAAVSGILGFLGARKPPENTGLYAKEGFVIVSLSYIIISLIGAVPFVINGDIPFFIDAFFETASGFTTTGASILNDVEILSHSSLFWRSFTQLIGGMGVLVFALAVLPKTEAETVHIMKAEVPGPTFGKLVSRLADSARILYIIYITLTAVTAIFLILFGMPVFDALLHAFGAAGTSGFAMTNLSVHAYNSLAIEVTLAAAMILFGINFNLYFLIFTRHIKEAFSSEELKWYLGIIAGSIALITLQLTSHDYGFWNSLRDSFFTVSSSITTTGFVTANYNNWPLFSRVLLLTIMFVGGMAGSTSGGLKVSRVGIAVKSAFSELKRTANPNRTVSVHFESKPIESHVLRAVANYILIYLVVFIILILFFSIETPDFTTAFTSVAAMFNNTGQGLEGVGPDASFAAFGNYSKIVLSIAMVMGRLEIFPVLILFSPRTWREAS